MVLMALCEASLYRKIRNDLGINMFIRILHCASLKRAGAQHSSAMHEGARWQTENK